MPDGERFPRMTEACQSVGEQAWGYRADEDYFSVRYLTQSIDKIMAMGGSYLLNVGPMPNGKIPEQAKKIIERVGDWYVRMNGVLEGHEPYPALIRLQHTPCVATVKDGKTYLHLYEGSISSSVNFDVGPAFAPKAARLVNDGRTLGVRLGMLPGWGGRQGLANGPILSITGIPCDEFENEPLVIEIEW